MWAQIAFSRSEQFQNFLGSLFELPGQDDLIGVSINFHPIWWQLATLWHRTGIEDPDIPWWALHPDVLGGWSLVPRPDPDWRNKYWSNLCNSRGKKDYPFLTRICLRTGINGESRRRFSEFARSSSTWCTTEERPLAVTAANFEGGRDMTASAPGTLGGFFKDNNGSRIFGVTCGHVGQTKGASVSIQDALGVNHQNVGTVVESTFSSLTPLTTGQSCNRNTAGGITNVDVALIELAHGHAALNTIASVGKIDAIFDSTQFGAGDAVEMRGAASKHHNFYVGAYDAVYKVLYSNGNIHCFEHMFEINRQALTSSLVPPILAAKAVQGDSGACVCCASPTGNAAYCGTLVAVDGTNGYACFAEAVRGWAANLSPKIDLAPL